MRRRQHDRPQFDAHMWEHLRPTTRKRFRATRATFRTARWLTRRGWARRRPLAPLYGTLAVFILGAVAHLVDHGDRSIELLAGLAATTIAGWQWRARRRPDVRHVLRPFEWAWAGCVWAAVTAWLMAAAELGPFGPRLGWLWLAILPPAWITAAIRYNVRPKVVSDGPIRVQVLDPRMVEWQEEAACADGVAPGSIMHQPEPLRADDPSLAWKARIELPRRSKVGASALVGKTEGVAMIYDRPLSDIAIEPVEGTSPRWADLTVFTRNPLLDTVWWPGPADVFNPQTGVAHIARYATGGMAPYRFYRASGPVHDLIAGTTDAGKSGFINALLAIERAHPRIASVVIDPQQGQSLPEWKKNVAVYARSVEEGADVMVALTTHMYQRNEILSNVEWTDDKGRKHEGVDAFDINSPVIARLGMPLLSVTIEECGDALQDPTILGCAIKIATMARKCGIKLRLVAQVPLLDQLRSSVLRDMLVGGNVIVFRTANKLSAQVAFNGVLPADPSLLPREWPDGSTTAGLCYVLGPNAKSTIARTMPIEDTYHWATVGETTRLPYLEALAGYAHEVRSAKAAAAGEPATAPATAKAPATGTYVQRVKDYLAEHHLATTGSIAAALGSGGKPAALSTISQTCRRLADKGAIVDHGNGMWGAAAVREEAAA